MDSFQLPRSFTGYAADDLDERSVLRELNDAVIVVTVGDKNIAVRRDEGVAGPVEGSVRGVVAFHTLGPDRHNLFPFLREFVFDLTIPVADPYKSKAVHVDIVIIDEDSRSPRIHEFS